MVRLLLLASLTALTPSAHAQDGQRPMDEMQGDCANYRWNMTREMVLWNAMPQMAKLSAAPVADAPTIVLDRKHEVALAAHPGVTFAAKPEQDRGAPDRFSGIARLTVPADGLYRISAGSGLWIDVVTDGRLVKSEQFEMQTKCLAIFKSVAFRLRAGSVYWLQLSGNRTPTIGVLVTPATR